jgi:hypothetical protein
MFAQYAIINPHHSRSGCIVDANGEPVASPRHSERYIFYWWNVRKATKRVRQIVGSQCFAALL